MRWYTGLLLSFLFAIFAMNLETDTQAQEISFWETWALSEDREKTLEQLVPGSEEYFYFHCLHYQQSVKLDEVDAMLKRWAKKHGKTSQYYVIENRQALLKYSDDPRKTLDFLKKKLGLDFSHQRRLPQAQQDLASKLDPSKIDLAKIVSRLLRQDSNSLSGFENSGLKWLAGKPLNTRQRRDLLKRVTDPTFPGLVDLIAADLQGKGRSNFGSLNIHKKLTQAQLQELAKKIPSLNSQQNYINEAMLRLLPSADVSIEDNPQEHENLVKRQWDFVRQLSPAFNSLKTNVLYHLLDIGRRKGSYDRKLFVEYLKIPRHVHYINRSITKNANRSQIVSLGQDFSGVTRCIPFSVDAPLVQDYLHHFLADASNSKSFLPYFEEKWLQQQFATAKILAGKGDREQLAALLSPDDYKRLLERVDLDFATTNREHFGSKDPISLTLHTKNVDKLIVKVFEINTRNFYRKFNREIDTDIKLDGLVANSETLHEYDDSPLLRVKREFKFDDLKKDGVYVIDFIGGGQSSRALIRRGRMFMVGRVSPIGQRFKVIDDEGAVLMDASVEVGGRKYVANKKGYIDMPFSDGASRQTAIISVGDFSCLQPFDAVRESYELKAAFHVDRESLTAGNEATVFVRPSLRIVGDHPILLSRLESSQLEIISTTVDGNKSTKTITDFAIEESRDATATFRVPARLRAIQFVLRATIKGLTKQEINLAASDDFKINEIDSTNQIQDLHFLPTSKGYFVEVRGKTGEARPKQPVRVSLKLVGLKNSVDVDLQSDANGRVDLGSLENVKTVSASLAGASSKTWSTHLDRSGIRSNYHLLAGETLALPWPAGQKLEPAQISLIEYNAQRAVSDRFGNLKAEKGRLIVSDLKPGDYQLRMSDPESGQDSTVQIRVTQGSKAASSLVGESRVLSETSLLHPFVIDAGVDEGTITVAVADATKHTRVHVFPMRYSPAFNPADQLDGFGATNPWTWQQTVQKSRFIAGRKIGDEYQYILNRRYEKQFPGNMLERPSLLLNPWALQETKNESQLAAAGEQAAAAGSKSASKKSGKSRKRTMEAQRAGFANVDFLGGGQSALMNLTPDKKGQIKITAKQLGNAQHVRVVVVDRFSVSQKSIYRSLKEMEPADQRLIESLDSKQHFVRQRQIEILDKGDSFVIEDLASSDVQRYDQLADVFRLYRSMGSDAGNFRKFAFVMDWLEKSPEEKRSLYSEFACHELNFFIYKKDRSFFDDVVVKHLQHKRERTFLDRWLLEEDLSEWFKPWNFARLNVFEKVLLSQRLKTQRGDIVRHVQELYELNPTKRGEFVTFFGLAKGVNELDDAKKAWDNKPRSKALPSLSMETGKDPVSEVSEGIAFGGGGGRDRMQQQGQSSSSVKAEEYFKLGPARRELQKNRPAADFSLSDGVEKLFESDLDELGYDYFDHDYDGERDQSLPLNYRRVDPTREWVENNYYHLHPSANVASRIGVNQFWKDYAVHQSGPFASDAFAMANGNLSEMILALAVLDLPMSEVKENISIVDNKMTIKADAPMIVLHQQNESVAFERGDTSIFVSENFFESQDRYRYEEGVRFDKFVNGDFLAGVLYGSEVVITNPTSTPMAIDVLIQIPQGAMPVSGSQNSQSVGLQLAAFSTQKIEYWFYFPTAGEFAHYPAHVSTGVKILAVAEGRGFKVVDEPAEVDKTSWVWVSQNGTDEEVIRFLETENIQRLDPSQIAFRMKDQAFYLQAVELLRSRCRYNHLLWSYSVKHNDKASLREYLDHENSIVSSVGMSLNCDLFELDPVERNWYQQRGYTPLINSRAHQLGAKRRILNPRFYQQYDKLMQVLGTQAELSDDDRLVVTYYLLLQDRIAEALDYFGKVDLKNVDAKMQYAYCDAYLDLYREKPDQALAKANKWVDYPVDRWRTKFENIVAMVKEIEGASAAVTEEESRAQQQDKLAAESQSFELEIEPGKTRGSGKATIEYRNLKSFVVNYYEMDIEFLFSSNPFSSDQADGFSMIRPNLSQTIKVKGADGSHAFELPDQFNNKNVLVEVIGGEQTRSKAWFANSMNVQMVEAYGQVALTQSKTGKPISKAYVKVFAKHANGQAKFHKDGYTDLRGRFDYVSQSNRSLNGIVEYAVLIMSDEHGAVIREARPPRE